MITSREEAVDLIIEGVKELFSPEGNFSMDLDTPISWNCDDFDPSVLENWLNSIEGCELAVVDNNDSINDIVDNNFKF